MKKIFFVISSLQNHGGTERVATILANKLSEYYDVTILSRGVDSQDNAFKLLKEVNDIKFETSTLGFIKLVKSYIYKESPDIVAIHTMSKLTPSLLLSGLKANQIWSIEHTSFLFSPLIFRSLRKLLYHKVDKVIALTERDKKNYLSFSHSVEVIPNISPVPITTKPYDNTSKKVVTIGHLEHHKGYDLLLKAWKNISLIHPNWKLEIYGKGSKKASLEEYCRVNKLNTVYFKGLTNNPIEVYDNAALYVMSSRYEGLPLVLIEAQSRGVPIISFDCPYGPAEVVNDHIDGLLVKPNDISQLTKSIIKLIDTPSIREQYSHRSKESAKRFSEKNIISKWVSLIESSSNE